MSDPVAPPVPLVLGEGEILTTWGELLKLGDEWETRRGLGWEPLPFEVASTAAYLLGAPAVVRRRKVMVSVDPEHVRSMQRMLARVDRREMPGWLVRELETADSAIEAMIEQAGS